MTIYESVRDRLATSYEHVFMFACEAAARRLSQGVLDFGDAS